MPGKDEERLRGRVRVFELIQDLQLLLPGHHDEEVRMGTDAFVLLQVELDSLDAVFGTALAEESSGPSKGPTVSRTRSLTS
jgi:hypothetical protein